MVPVPLAATEEVDGPHGSTADLNSHSKFVTHGDQNTGLKISCIICTIPHYSRYPLLCNERPQNVITENKG